MTDKKTLRSLFWNSANNQAFGTSLLKDPKWSHINMAEKAQILSLIQPLAGLRVLELGGGIGRYTTDLARQTSALTVVDLSEQALQENRERHREFSHITYIVGDVTELQFEPNSFDLIFSSWLLMYLNADEIKQLLAHCRTWLPAHGKMFFRESCECNYAGYHIVRNWFTLEMIRTILPIVGKPIYSPWKFKVPALKDLWTAIRHFQKPQYFRKAAFYEACFAEYCETIDTGYITIYDDVYRNQRQRYWLLAPKI
jgi:ubiquinone/menaquinone biosynthesis C-methylase UbiE